MNTTGARVVVVVAVLAAVGVAFSAIAMWSWVESETADSATAASTFEEARAVFAGQAPVVIFDGLTPVRRALPAAAVPAPSALHVLVYHQPTQRLIRAEVPFWFLRIKGSASERALAGTGIDLGELGLSVGDLMAYGPSLVLDEVRGENRVLLWTR